MTCSCATREFELVPELEELLAANGEYEGEFEDESFAYDVIPSGRSAEDSVPSLARELEIIGSDSRVQVTNPTSAPYRFICNFEYDFGGSIGKWPMCSGTLIGSRTVLTAAHCLFDCNTGRPRDPRRMRVIPGRAGASVPLPASPAVKFVFPPGYTSCGNNAGPKDYAIIHLRDAIGSRVGYWTRTYSRRSGDSVGTSILPGSLPMRPGVLKVNVCGYPADKPSASSFGCRDLSQPRKRCRHSLLGDSRRSRLCGAFQFRAFDRTVVLRSGMLHYLNDTCPGHSGSPVWVRRHPNRGGRVLVGIHVAGDDPAIRGLANRAVFIDRSVRDFIIRNTR